MLGFLASLLGGPLVSGVLDAYKARLAAANSAEAHAVDLAKAEVAAAIAARANAKEIRLATSGFFEVRALFFLIGFGFALHTFAVCCGTTLAPLLDRSSWLLHIPALPTPLDAYEGQVIAFFFGSAVAMTGVQAIAAALARRTL
ncbi:MAG: hypothetical protein U1E56_02570 [Bauldia sp.]